MHSYIVLFVPISSCTVRAIKAIDAFGCDSTRTAREYMLSKVDQYREKHGIGTVQIVKTSSNDRRIGTYI